MCGIVARWRPAGGLKPDALVAALAALAPRGPDGQGTWRSEDGRVALGHTRLAVRGGADAAQPTVAADGGVVAVVNGELYDVAAARAEAEAAGSPWRTTSDAELVVERYARDGLGGVEALRGEFCFALWDPARQRLVAARDRFGTRTCVWRAADGGLDLASEAKGLFALGGPRRWDRRSLTWALALQYLPPDRTLFDGVAMLPPGHLLIADADGVRVERWARPAWRPPAPGPAGGVAEAPARFRAGLERAVADRLESEAGIGFHLSGGVDSATVLGLAARLTGQRLPAFTASFPGTPLDERAAAEANARHAGAELTVVEVRARDLVDHVEAAALAGEGLAVNGHLVAHFLLDRAIAAAGLKSVLSGEGADELLAGYPHLRADLRGELPPEDSTACRGIMLPTGGGLPTAGLGDRLGFVPTWVQAKAEIGARLATLTHDAWTPAPGDPFAELVADEELPTLRALRPVDAALTLWTRLALGGYILPTLSDRLLGAHGLEGRLPFLDPALFDRVAELPLEARIRGDTEKWLLREAARGLVPEATRARRKHPFLAPSPFDDPEARALLDERLQGDAFGAPAVFDPVKVRARLRALDAQPPAARAAWAGPLMIVLSAHAVGRAFALEGP